MEHTNPLQPIQEALHQGELSRCEALLYQAFKNTPQPAPELIHLSALWHHSCGRSHQALQILRALLQQVRTLPHFIWNDLGSLYAQNQQAHLAEQCFKHALSQAPDLLLYAFNYARSLHDQQLYSKAAGVYMELLRRAPEHKEYRSAAIETFVEMGELHQAQLLFSQFQHPSGLEYVSAQCLLLKHPNTPEKALQYLEALDTNTRQSPEVQALIAFYAKESHDHKKALSIYTQLSKAQPDVLDWAILAGLCLIAQNHYPAAEEHFQNLLQKNPQHPQILMHLGDVSKRLNHAEEAIKYWSSYVALAPYNAEVQYNLGNLFSSQKNYTAAVACFEKAVLHQPEFLEAWINLTLAYYENRAYAEAEQAAHKAVHISPENSRARIGYGDALLMQQKYAEGFNEIEWRFAEKNYQKFKYPAPPWNGEDLNHRHILVMSEQGLGDIILFSRFIFDLQARYPEAKISFRCRPELLSLFRHWPFKIYADGETVENVDYAVALMSLLKRLAVTPQSLPAPDHLNTTYALSESLCRKITTKGANIGLVWSSGEGLTQSKRSLNAELLVALISQHPHYHFYGLQKGPASHNSPLNALENYADLAPHLQDFSDTAACCQSLDLVISVDTSVAHLAGTLNTPVWILLPFSPDWRWGATGTLTPWYPSASLIRQDAIDDWPTVIDKVNKKLSKHFPAPTKNA